MKRTAYHPFARRYSHIFLLALLITLCALPLLQSATAQNGASDQQGGKRVAPLPRTKGAPGPKLPDLSTFRKSVPAQPQAPPPVSNNRQCFDCGERGEMRDFAAARLEARNRTGQRGVDLLSQNFHWSLPLVQLKGRADLDLNLSLAYNSLVWTKAGSRIAFDADKGQPAPGFRLGLPTLQTYRAAQTGADGYLMITPSGNRVEMRRIGNSKEYHATDGSLLQLTDQGAGGAILRLPNGEKLTFAWAAGQLQCTEVKDRNGNFITINYNRKGHIARITDTLGRVILFNRDSWGNLLSITQAAEGRERVLATFGYSDLTVQTNFSNLEVVGPANGTAITVLTQVGLPSGIRYQFSYTSWGQVWQISRQAADSHILARTSYDFPRDSSTALEDSPRVNEQRFWAESWNGEKEITTRYKVDPSMSWGQMTTPDGTVHKQFFGTQGWQKGLMLRAEVWADGKLQKWTILDWRQDGNINERLNPRLYETNIFDAEGNRRRSRVEYGPYGLPRDVYEYDADGATMLRRTRINYNFSPEYIHRHIFGLVSEHLVYDENGKLQSKTTYDYDLEKHLIDQGTAVQHDSTNFGANFRLGRGLLNRVSRWDAAEPNDRAKAFIYSIGYNATGARAFRRDQLGNETNISYEDGFADGQNRSTLAYATTITNPNGTSSSTQYDYDTGVAVRTQSSTGSVMTQDYDDAGRLILIRDQKTGGYARWVYAESGTLTASFSKSEEGAEETESYTIADGAGRVRATATNHPSSRGGYSGSYIFYDEMGRPTRQTNPTEMTPSWLPTGDDTDGWVWSEQQYDWRGRLAVSVNADGTTRRASYGGCGCAGGEVVTFIDESGRSRRSSKDSLGRLAKVEELNWDGSIYSTTEYTYDALDQVTKLNQSGQLRAWEYDGRGRLTVEVTPERGRAEYRYDRIGLLKTVQDARGATTTFNYNKRLEITDIVYQASEGVEETPTVRFGYDDKGRRAWMKDGPGRVDYRYNEAGQLIEETRQFTNLPDSAYALKYEYSPNGRLARLSSSWGGDVSYSYDDRGRLAGVADGNDVVVSDIERRAWGSIKQMRYGNGRELSVGYDERLRVTRWDVNDVAGSEYTYDEFGENTGRVTRARDLYDPTLNLEYRYDNVGRLQASYAKDAGEAQSRGLNNSKPQDTRSASYLQQYRYDVWGNLLEKSNQEGMPTYQAAYNNNRLEQNPFTGQTMSYDAAGNLLDDGQQRFTYDAAGRQRTVTSEKVAISQTYDGNGLRAARVENGVATYYLRSSILGGQVIAELDQTGEVVRSNIYMGQHLLATKNPEGILWAYNDPVTKAQRLVDVEGRVVNETEVDPWGNEAAGNLQADPDNRQYRRRFTTYERDANGSDDAMYRRYNPHASRFEQPDPYRGSYNLADPQSFNRYAYAGGDPVNRTDPTGLTFVTCYYMPPTEYLAGYIGCDYTGDEPLVQPVYPYTETLPPLDPLAPCDVQIPTDPEQLALLYTIMHEATSGYRVGQRQYQDGDTLGNRTGPIMTEEVLLREAHLIASAIKNMAIVTNRTIQATIMDPSYITDGSGKTPQQFYQMGINLTNQAKATPDGSPECERLKRIIHAATTPGEGLPYDYKWWKAVPQEGGVRPLNQGDVRVGDTDITKYPGAYPGP